MTTLIVLLVMLAISIIVGAVRVQFSYPAHRRWVWVKEFWSYAKNTWRKKLRSKIRKFKFRWNEGLGHKIKVGFGWVTAVGALATLIVGGYRLLQPRQVLVNVGMPAQTIVLEDVISIDDVPGRAIVWVDSNGTQLGETQVYPNGTGNLNPPHYGKLARFIAKDKPYYVTVRGPLGLKPSRPPAGTKS